MHFDGALSRHSAGARVVITFPSGEETIYSFRLEFDCTNNVVEYEALLLGLEIARDRKIKCLSVVGDSNLIVSQARNQFAAKKDRLRTYRNAVWDTIELFDAFSIKFVPREDNSLADALAVAASTFEVPDALIERKCKVEVLFRPCVPDNQDY